MGKCIWCKKNTNDKDIEHIFPESLGCPEEFILKDGIVCKKCNNDLSHLDKALIHDLDLVLFWHGIPRKKNKMPTINTRGNVYGEYVNGKKAFKFNMTKDSVNMDGHDLGGFGKSKRNIKVDSEVIGNKVSHSFSTEFGTNKKVIRAIYKIGLSSLVYFKGEDEAYKKKYDNIREFVLNGKGTRKLILLGTTNGNSEFKNIGYPPWIKDGDYAIAIRIACIEFAIDLSENMTFYPILYNKMKEIGGKKGWGYLPIEE